MINLKKIKSIHFTGIKGVGMTALALCALDLGIKVSGSDLEELFVTDAVLKKAGIKWQVGFSPDNISKPDLLIYTAAHNGEENIEVITAKKQKIKVLPHAQALGLFMQGKAGISVAGVGGKSTTSSMISTIFEKAGLNPSFAVGVGEINPLGFPGKLNLRGKHFIAEADEYFTSPQNSTPRFLYQNPKVIVITNIEHDHPDVYKNLKQILNAFSKFAAKIPKNGLLVACIDNPNVEKLLLLIKAPVVTYGFSPKADWQITSINQTGKKMNFSLKNKNKAIKNISLSVPGKYNVYNAAAAFAAASFFGIKENEIKKGLAQFKGTKRRFEFIKEIKGIRLYDDYAHHPTEIKAVLKAAKNWFLGKRIIAVFQPHTYSRTKALFKDFASSFKDADIIYLAPIYASAREKETFKNGSRKLADAVKKKNKRCFFVKDKYDLIEKLLKQAKRGDVVITIGAGDIFLWHKTIINNL